MGIGHKLHKEIAHAGDPWRWKDLVAIGQPAQKDNAKAKDDSIALSEDQQEAVDSILEEDGPFFLTGPAGSGKSHVINYLRANVDDCVVTAMTGVAAQLIGGRTLHAFAGIHPLYGVVKSNLTNSRVQKCELLIIDEISMASVEVMEQLHERFEYAEHFPKLVMVGDFLQLPPVDGEKLFDTEDWKYCITLKLTGQHRQQDKDFIDVLNDIRVGKMTDAVKEFIKDRQVAELPDDCTHLMAYRNSVHKRNMEKLTELPGQMRKSIMEVMPPSEPLKSSKRKRKTPRTPTKEELSRTRFEDVLLLKEKARVVMLTNERHGRWVNGSGGEVVSIQKGEVRVRLNGGNVVSVTKECESILNGNGDEICKIYQYPVKLAWALTIHKAQGLTLDRVGVDLNGHFETGQTYVALSRCRTKEGLYLVGSIDEIMVDESALKYCG